MYFARFSLVVLLASSLSAAAAESVRSRDVPDRAGPVPANDGAERLSEPGAVAGATAFTAANLLTELAGFLRQRNVEVDRLTADQMVALMIDWYRFVPAYDAGSGSTIDTLVYRYGGWSEGCATGFKLSLLRRARERGTGDVPDRIAGITLMFEPSGGANLAPFSTASSDWNSIEAFLEAVRGSPAFRQFGTAIPMAVMLERGGLR